VRLASYAVVMAEPLAFNPFTRAPTKILVPVPSTVETYEARKPLKPFLVPAAGSAGGIDALLSALSGGGRKPRGPTEVVRTVIRDPAEEAPTSWGRSS